jgi:hypothetical protein
MPSGKTQKSARQGGKKNNSQAKTKAKKPAQRKQRSRQNQTVSREQSRTAATSAPNAFRLRLPTVGMSDLLQHRITWVAGTIYVGNGTLGASDKVYFGSTDGTKTFVAGGGGGFWIPFAPADPLVGSTYANSILKLYRRVRIRQARCHVLTQQSSTTNNLVVAVAPCRGPPGYSEIAQYATGTNAAQTLQNLMSISGMESCDSFENMTLNLTPYIAGGSGGKQNEFAIANTLDTAEEISSTSNLLGLVPCAIQVAGNSTVTALRGSATHLVVMEMECDLLDFVGAVPVIFPVGFRSALGGAEEGKEERRGRLLAELSAIARDDRARRDVSCSPVRSSVPNGL